MEPLVDRPRLDIRRIIAAVALGVFAVALPVAGFLVNLPLGFLALAVSALVTSYFVGSDE